MKKRKKVFLVGIITIFVFFSGLLVRQVLAIQSADCVVRVDFRGIENMFHVPHGVHGLQLHIYIKRSVVI
ncbi:MAG: hypothetical protein NC412_09650 [Roseburia sp.]|nr:hypothetical protein [Roseburia sp.]MCM1279147.1 hypothetical protein [Robinsoniella sp.]